MATKNPPNYVESHNLLEEKVVVVTAAAGTGIGSAVARRCIEEGATVIISDVHEKRLEATCDALGQINGERPLSIVCDVTKEQQVQNLFDKTIEEVEDSKIRYILRCNPYRKEEIENARNGKIESIKGDSFFSSIDEESISTLKENTENTIKN